MEDPRQRFERLLAPHHDAALAFARCVSRSQADGDDLFQVALLRAYGRLDQLRDDGAFRGWLYRIIFTVHCNGARRSFWRRFAPFGREHDVAVPPEADALGAAQRAQVALATLSPEQRAAIVLFDIEGHSVEEVAAIQGCSITAVKSRLVRGRERLRHVYTHRLGAAAPALLPAPGGTP